MGDKTDKNTIAWLAQPEEHDYPAAQSYLNLLYDDAHCAKLVRKLHAAPMSAFKAKDILRASGLSPLGMSNAHVERDLKKSSPAPLCHRCCWCARKASAP
ncbi:hypothetical protein [Pseudomonas syringae]|uniref:hypothetical protein n=1 Tax=Pseudomonas syringae TaxID=317 RepID=UPI0006E61602|nr:hypothetical protein ALO48_200161 [Pseudomonas syringae pv. rhaphiolepidis]